MKIWKKHEVYFTVYFSEIEKKCLTALTAQMTQTYSQMCTAHRATAYKTGTVAIF